MSGASAEGIEWKNPTPRRQRRYLEKWLVVWFGWHLPLRSCSVVFKRLLGFEDMELIENVIRTV